MPRGSGYFAGLLSSACAAASAPQKEIASVSVCYDQKKRVCNIVQPLQ